LARSAMITLLVVDRERCGFAASSWEHLLTMQWRSVR
jgi:hypothetical protein